MGPLTGSGMPVLEIENLPGGAIRPGFAGFLYPRHRYVLTGEIVDYDVAQPAPEVFTALTAALDGVPAGCLLLGPDRPGLTRVFSIMTAPPLRRRGVAAALLAQARSVALASGHAGLIAYHNDRMRLRGAYEALLQHAGWQTPVLEEVRVGGPAGPFAEKVAAKWSALFRRQDDEGFGLMLHSTRPPGADAAITALCESGQVEEMLRPVGWIMDHADPAVSILLLHHGRIVGWIIGERSPRMEGIHYTLGYVVPSLRRAGWLFRGLMEVTRLQAAAYGPDSPAAYETRGTNQAMIRTILDHVAPFAAWTDRRFQARLQWADLPPQPVPA